MKPNVKTFLILCIPLAMMSWGCNQASSSEAPGGSDTNYSKGQSTVQDSESEPNILNIAIGSKDHTTLVTAVQAAKLEDVLTNAGPLTVFAPNNDAFGKLPAGTVENLVKPENKTTLARIIKHHATPGTWTKDNIRDGQQMFMATGYNLKMAVNGDEITINGAKILGTVKASNGIVHVIDQVLLPPDE